MATRVKSSVNDVDVRTKDGQRVVILTAAWWTPTLWFNLFEFSRPGRHKRVVVVPTMDSDMIIPMADALGVHILQLSRTRYINYILPDDSAAFALEMPAHFLSTEADNAFCGRNLSLTVEKIP